MLDLKNKVALVTGGSRGIGRSISIHLANAGAYVYVNYNSNESAANETLSLCPPNTAQIIKFNVSNPDEVESAIMAIQEKSGKLDILVNNAGITSDNLLIRLKNEDWDKTLAINLTGAFNCSKAASRIMMKSRWGRIINISSIVGQMGNAGQVAYVATKAGLIGLTKSLARELAQRNITVNAIAPGYIDTDMTTNLSTELKEKLTSNIPLGRIGIPNDIAPIVTFLSSDCASYITGQVIGVNGGMYM